MSNAKRRLALTLAMVMCASALTACGGGGESTTAAAETEAAGEETTAASEETTAAEAAEETEAAAAGETDGIIRWQVPNVVDSMDITMSNDYVSCGVLSQCIEGLYTKDAEGTPIFAMASDLQVSEDGLTYTYTIRDDVYWTNGDPVTANDFEFSWKRLADETTASSYRWFIEVACLKNAAEIMAGEVPASELGVTAADDKTLVVELGSPCPMFESVMLSTCFSPINQSFYEACGENYATSADTIICNGPFKITDYQPSAMTISAVKNEDYYDADKVQLKGIEWQVMEESQTAAMAFDSGQLDVVTLTGSVIEQYLDDPQFSTKSEGRLWYISPNHTVEGLDNVNIRTALAKSFNKEAITNNVLKDGSATADAIVPQGLAISSKGTDFRDDAGQAYDSFTYDVAAAQEAWNAGLSELGVDSLSFTLLCEDTDSAQAVAQFLQSEWQTNLPGLTIELMVEPKTARLEDMRNGNYEIGLTRWGPDYGDPMTYMDIWATESVTNYESWSSADYDATITSAKTGELALDLDARWQALIDCEKQLADEVVVFPAYIEASASLIKSNVSGIQYYTLGIPYLLKNVTLD